MEAGAGQAFVDAREKFKALLEAFLLHIHEEEALLKPILERCSAWGPVRLEQLEREHQRQRIRVAALVALDAETSAAHWTALMRQFAADLRSEMDGEEHDFLFPNVLRGGPV